MTYDPVEPGLYRVRDATSGVVSAPFEVFSKGAASEASIDVSDVVRVRGRVEARGESGLRGVRVLVSAYGVDFYDGFLPGKAVAADGTFELWLPAGREPVLLAKRFGGPGGNSREGPSVAIAGARDGLVLTLND